MWEREKNGKKSEKQEMRDLFCFYSYSKFFRASTTTPVLKSDKDESRTR